MIAPLHFGVRELFVAMSCRNRRAQIFFCNFVGQNDNSVKQSIKSNSVSSGYVSHCWTSIFTYHFNHHFVIQKNTLSFQIEKTSRSTGRYQRCSDQNCHAWLASWFVFCCACLMGCYATSFFLVHYLWCCSIGLGKNETLIRSNPTDQELEFHPCGNLHREK